jgi:fatty-acyl-CoA synthase
MALPQCTLEIYETRFRERRLLHESLDHWAALKPAAPAVANATSGVPMSWSELESSSRAVAAFLLDAGFRKGDYLATSLPLTNDHIVLEYACFRSGVIHAPLDMRLSKAELARCLDMLQPKGYATALPSGAWPEGRSLEYVWDTAGLAQLARPTSLASSRSELPAISPGDAAQVIFTTGSTGKPKPALLSHGSITSQNYCLGEAFDFDGRRTLVNLPPSHVGCQAELLLTTLFWGGTAVTLEVFDPGKSLEAIERYRVQLLGQIPAMFLLEWRHSDFGRRDLSSLETVVYGGQSVPRPFLEQLARMAPMIATGLGLTETSGFCTYTPLTADPDALSKGIGFSMPLYPMTIRREMNPDGSAGEELPTGETGHVCFRGPQTFLGYAGDPQATARTVSTDGFLYTGDMGYQGEAGLHFSGRAKWVIKPAGYQVFPSDVEDHICALTDKVASCGVVGVAHPIWVEAIVAIVEKRPGAELTEAELRRHARSLSGYMRPLHYLILEPGQMPLNRVAKLDTLKLKELAERRVEELRRSGRWESDPEEVG